MTTQRQPDHDAIDRAWVATPDYRQVLPNSRQWLHEKYQDDQGIRATAKTTPVKKVTPFRKPK